jgi:hypothetical protein
MKLFQQLLVAGAAASLLAPLASQATEVNIDDMNSYSGSKSSKIKFDSNTFSNEDFAVLKGRVDGLEAQQNNFEAGSFSDTTTLDGKAVFSIGAIDWSDSTKLDEVNSANLLSDAVLFQYTYQMNLNTSFTGDDNLYVRLKTGNNPSATGAEKAFGDKRYGTYLSATNANGDVLKVDKMWYTMPVGDKTTVFIGPKIENYYMHGTTPSIYKPVLKQFTLGGNAAAYGASTSPGAGISFDVGNGVAISSNFTTQSGNSTGLLTNEGKTSWATQVGYTQPRYSVSAIVNQKYNEWTDSYFTTPNGKARPVDGDSTNIGLRAWWRPAETGTATPSVSVGYDTSQTDATSNSNTTMYFVGLNWEDTFQSDDRIGVAFGQPQTREDEVNTPFAWEAYYSFKVNDSIEVTPTVFGATDRNAAVASDLTGVVVNTTFKF